MRNAMHHILYTVVNSSAMNGWSASDTLKDRAASGNAIYALIAVLAVPRPCCAHGGFEQGPQAQEMAGTLSLLSTRNVPVCVPDPMLRQPAPKAGHRPAAFIKDKGDRNGRTKNKASRNCEPRKTYQLVLFPLNNGATSIVLCAGAFLHRDLRQQGAGP